MDDTLQMPAGGGHESAPPGERLAEARQAQNLTTADVARQLKLSVWQVEALEAGRYQQLPGAVFVRGFIRNYARIVRIDPEELLRTAGNSVPQQAARSEAPPSHDIPFPNANSSRWPAYAAAAAVIFVALGAYEFFWEEPDSGARWTAAVTPAPVAPAAKRESTPPPTPAASGSLQSEAVAAPVAEEITPTNLTVESPVPPAVLPTVAERPPRPGEKPIRLDFDQESWVEIRDRNENVIFSQLNRPGTSRQLSGLPPLSVVVGNAHGVRMTYDDRPVDLDSHTKIDVARLILQ